MSIRAALRKGTDLRVTSFGLDLFQDAGLPATVRRLGGAVLKHVRSNLHSGAISAAPKAASDRIINSSDTGNPCYDADGSGGASGNTNFDAPVGSPALTTSDFPVIQGSSSDVRTIRQHPDDDLPAGWELP